MAKVYFVRHQAAGLLIDYPFVASPSEEQVEALTRACRDKHGDFHPKTNDPYWVQVSEYELIESEIPSIRDLTLKIINEAGVAQNAVSGFGKVQ